MFLITAVPVALGMVITAKSSDMVNKIAPGISNDDRLAVGLFVLIVIAALAKNWEAFFGNLATLGPVAISLIMLMLGLGLATAKLMRLDKKI